jgi:hypothetical protein
MGEDHAQKTWSRYPNPEIDRGFLGKASDPKPDPQHTDEIAALRPQNQSRKTIS